MTSRSRVLALALFGASALSVGIFVTRPRPEAPPAPTEITDHEAPADAAPAPAPARAAEGHSPLVPGDERVFSVEFTQSVALGNASSGKAGARPQALAKTFRAGMRVLCFSHETGRLRFRVKFERLLVSVNGHAVSEGADFDALRKPFTVETDGEGRVLGLAFGEGVSAEVRGLLKAVVAAGQVVVRPGPRWIAREEDTSGEYEASYQRTSNPQHVRKERLRYLSLTGPDGSTNTDDAAKVTLVDDTKIELAKDETVTSVQSKTETRIPFAQLTGEVAATQVFAMTLESQGKDIAAVEPAKAEREHQQVVALAAMTDVLDAKTHASMRKQMDENTLRGAKFDDVMRELADVRKGPPRARAVVASRLRADFRLRPEDAHTAARQVASAPVEDGMLITSALGGAATAETLKALADIASAATTPQGVRLNAVTGLGLTRGANADVIKALDALRNDPNPEVRGAASLALGSAAWNLRDSDPASYEAAVTGLLAALAAAQTAEERALIFRALGNAGDARVLPLAAAALEHDETNVRVAAVGAVRRVPRPEADALADLTMKRDAEARVRGAAIDVIEGFRSVAEHLVPLTATAKTDKAPLVRRAALHAIFVVRALPDAMAVIRWSAANDPSEDVRRFANELLGAPPAQ